MKNEKIYNQPWSFNENKGPSLSQPFMNNAKTNHISPYANQLHHPNQMVRQDMANLTTHQKNKNEKSTISQNHWLWIKSHPSAKPSWNFQNQPHIFLQRGRDAHKMRLLTHCLAQIWPISQHRKNEKINNQPKSFNEKNDHCSANSPWKLPKALASSLLNKKEAMQTNCTF